MRILIVDDEEMTCLCVQEWIRKSCCAENDRVDTVCYAEEALKHVQKIGVDVLLTDIRMVEMNGLELIVEVKKLNPNVETIIMTAYAEFEYAQRAIQLGVRGFLLKPFSREELQKTLSGILPLQNKSSCGGAEEARYADPIRYAKQYVYEHCNSEINMARIANDLNLSYNYFSRMFSQQVGMTFSNYVMVVRMQEAARRLTEGDRINDIASSLGYVTTQNFTRAFVKYWKCTPSAYRDQIKDKNA